MLDGQFSVGLADGKVKLLKKDADENELKKLIMPADGEKIDWKKLER